MPTEMQNKSFMTLILGNHFNNHSFSDKTSSPNFNYGSLFAFKQERLFYQQSFALNTVS